MSTATGRPSNEDLRDLTNGVSQYCRHRLSDPTLARPGQRRDSGAARSQWDAMAAELGIGALVVDEQYGGAGATLVEAGRVAEALAAELASVPFLSAAVLAPALLTSVATDDAGKSGNSARDLLKSIAAENRVVTVALAGDDHGRQLHASVLGDGAAVTGSFHLVLDADVADVVILVGAGGTELVAVDVEHLTVTPRAAFDLTRGLADVTADNAPGRVLATGDRAHAAFQSMLTAGRLVLAADSAGGAQAALADAVSYAKERIQFGREIGSFQAIKHILADRYLDAELALSVSRGAAEAQVDSAPEATRLGLLAAFFCAEKFSAVAADDIQVHGGMGFTVECRAHRYRRRAETNRYLLGEPTELRAAYVRALTTEQAA